MSDIKKLYGTDEAKDRPDTGKKFFGVMWSATAGGARGVPLIEVSLVPDASSREEAAWSVAGNWDEGLGQHDLDDEKTIDDGSVILTFGDDTVIGIVGTPGSTVYVGGGDENAVVDQPDPSWESFGDDDTAFEDQEGAAWYKIRLPVSPDEKTRPE